MNQEIGRLRQEYGLKLSANEFFQILLEMHRLKLQSLASEDSDAISWMHQTLNDKQ